MAIKTHPENKDELALVQLGWLLPGIVLAGLPHWPRLPVWIPLVHIGLLFLRLYLPHQFPVFYSQQKTVINRLRILIVVVGIIGIYASYGTLTGRDVGIALLVMLVGFKILESKTKRDFYISAWLGYFLIITNFFYSQTIPTAVYMFFVIIVMTASLINFNDLEQQLSIAGRIKLSGSLIVQAIPLLLVLFILFPRVNGPLWGLPDDARTGITGIDDQMTPGTISKLVQSSEVAFRVAFEDKIPEPSTLYWRGPVLWQTDGRQWTSGASQKNTSPGPIEFKGEAVQYDITLEPTNKHWLFGLEMVATFPEESYPSHDYQLKLNEPIRQRRAFKLISYPEYYLGEDSSKELERGLRLPENSHEQTRQFGRDLRNKHPHPEQLVAAVLDWFATRDFVYTLRPPLITGDTVDDFLFNSRQGFCEHYAAAFTVIMRSAGIPARVVTGYLGGKINPLGHYLIVRQYHAHAWTEIWLEGQGWIRVDPTAVISNRVSDGIESALPDVVINVPVYLQNSDLAVRLWQRLGNAVDRVNYQWTQWVLGYSPERQRDLLQRIGLGDADWKKIAFAMFILSGMTVLITTCCLFRKTVSASDPARHYYDLFCKKMTRIGLSPYSFEGPTAFAERASLLRPDIKNEIKKISELYIQIRYGSEQERLPELRQRIKAFSPNKKHPLSDDGDPDKAHGFI